MSLPNNEIKRYGLHALAYVGLGTASVYLELAGDHDGGIDFDAEGARKAAAALMMLAHDLDEKLAALDD